MARRAPRTALRELARARPEAEGNGATPSGEALRGRRRGAWAAARCSRGANERPRPRRGEAAVKGNLPEPTKRHPPPTHTPPPPALCLLCFGTVPPARPSVRGCRLTAPPAPPAAPHFRAHGRAGGGETPASTLRVRLRTRPCWSGADAGGNVLLAARRERSFLSQKEEGG